MRYKMKISPFVLYLEVFKLIIGFLRILIFIFLAVKNTKVGTFALFRANSPNKFKSHIIIADLTVVPLRKRLNSEERSPLIVIAPFPLRQIGEVEIAPLQR